MKTIVLDKVKTIIIQDDEGKDRLIYQLYINGPYGSIFGLNGTGHSLKHLNLDHWMQLAALGLKKIDAVMNPRILDYLESTLPPEVKCERGEISQTPDGYSVQIVVFSLK
jgi:hypothetical protein